MVGRILSVMLLGVGVAAAAPTDKVKIQLGSPTVGTGLDAKAVTGVVKARTAKLHACYKAGVESDTELARVTATLSFTIDASGKVLGAGAIGLSDTVAQCMTDVVNTLVFAKPKDGVQVTVSFPVTFDPGVTGLGTIGTIGTGHSGPTRIPGRRSVDTPEFVKLGTAVVKGPLDMQIVRRYMKRNLNRLRYCYEKRLVVEPKTKGGAFKVVFVIDANGLVASLKISGIKDSEVDTCIQDTIKAIEFPKPKDGGTATVTYPMTLVPR